MIEATLIESKIKPVPKHEIEIAIATKLMGFRKVDYGFGWQHPDNPSSDILPPYTTRIDIAWGVVEKLKGQSVTINFGEDTALWEVSFIVGGKRLTGCAKEICMAICIAASLVIDENYE